MGSHKKFESSDDSDVEMRKAVDKKKQKDSREKNREIGPRKERHGSESDEEAREKKPRKEREMEEERKHKHREEDKSREKDRQRREERSGGGRDRGDDYPRVDRRDDRRRDWSDRGGNAERRRDNDRRRRDDGGKQRDNKLSQDEISRQRKMLWSKPNEKQEASSSNEETLKAETETGPTDKKATQWASSIAAAGVSGAQSNKFLKLLGIKKTPQDTMSTADLQKEKQRQQKMLTDLDKQYQVARESTHMGKGMGLGFH